MNNNYNNNNNGYGNNNYQGQSNNYNSMPNNGMNNGYGQQSSMNSANPVMGNPMPTNNYNSTQNNNMNNSYGQRPSIASGYGQQPGNMNNGYGNRTMTNNGMNNGGYGQPRTNGFNSGNSNTQTPLRNQMNNGYTVEPRTIIPNGISADNEELVRAYVGSKYDKFKASTFNVCGFFFTFFYLFYRKMFAYGLLIIVINIIISTYINIPIASIALNFLVGFLVNKFYLSFAEKKVTSIKASNSLSSPEEVKRICASKGGTSIPYVLLGIPVMFGILFLFALISSLLGIGSSITGSNINFNFGNTSQNEITIPSQNLNLKNVQIAARSCVNSDCYFSFWNNGEMTSSYEISDSDNEVFSILMEYNDYIKMDVTIKDSKISDYTIYSKASGEKVENVKNEDGLIEGLGLYKEGTHTDTLTYNNKTYNYNFTNSKKVEMEMELDSGVDPSNLKEGQQYTVEFKVTKDYFGYNYTIISYK